MSQTARPTRHTAPSQEVLLFSREAFTRHTALVAKEEDAPTRSSLSYHSSWHQPLSLRRPRYKAPGAVNRRWWLCVSPPQRGWLLRGRRATSLPELSPTSHPRTAGTESSHLERQQASLLRPSRLTSGGGKVTRQRARRGHWGCEYAHHCLRHGSARCSLAGTRL